MFWFCSGDCNSGSGCKRYHRAREIRTWKSVQVIILFSNAVPRYFYWTKNIEFIQLNSLFCLFFLIPQYLFFFNTTLGVSFLWHFIGYLGPNVPSPKPASSRRRCSTSPNAKAASSTGTCRRLLKNFKRIRFILLNFQFRNVLWLKLNGSRLALKII